MQQIALIQEKINAITESNISKSEQITQIIDHMEFASGFASETLDDLTSNRIVMTENSLSMINHEMRTPLVPIKAYGDMLLAGKFGKLEEKQREKVQIICKNANHLQRKIEVLFDREMFRWDGKPVDKSSHHINEITQQKIILQKINELLVQKSGRNDSEIEALQDRLARSEHEKNELAQEKSLLNSAVRMEETKNARLTRKNLTITLMAILTVSGVLVAYSTYVVEIVGTQHAVSHNAVPTSYLIQNLRGDTIDTWLSWRLLDGSTLHVGITNGERYPEKIPLIREVILSEESIQIDDSLLHKGPQGSTSTYFVGWLGALKHAAATDTQIYIPTNIEVTSSPGGEGNITIILTDERNGDGFLGLTKSIADEFQNQILKSTITIYETSNLDDEQFRTILRHEFGHALGLAHASAPEDLMAPVIATHYPYISECMVDSLVRLYDGGRNSQVVCEK